MPRPPTLHGISVTGGCCLSLKHLIWRCFYFLGMLYACVQRVSNASDWHILAVCNPPAPGGYSVIIL